MTAAMKQTLKVYIVNFEGCTTRMGFHARLVRTFGLDSTAVVKGQVWQAFCQRLASLGDCGIPVCIRLVGLDDAYSELSKECEVLLRVLRAAQKHHETIRAEAIVGEMKWKV